MALTTLLGAALLQVAVPVAVPVAADTAPARPAEPHGFCFRGKPLPRCANVVVYEVGGYRRVAGTTIVGRSPRGVPNPSSVSFRSLSGSVTVAAGVLHNTGPSTAVGAVIELGTGAGGGRASVLARYRRWLPGTNSVDLSAGIGAIGVTEPATNPNALVAAHQRLGLTGDAALRLRDWAIGSARVEVVPGVRGGTAAAAHVGVRVGSWQAVAASAAAVAWLALVIAAMASGVVPPP